MAPLVITGTGTGVGKTVVTAVLAAVLHARGVRVLPLKPLCSGGREDPACLRAAVGGAWSLDQINPWHYRSAIAPVLAARVEGRPPVDLPAVLQFIRASSRGAEVVLVEGAGGLLSPMGEGFTALDLASRLRSRVLLVAANRLGVIHEVRAVRLTLPEPEAAVILVNPPRPTLASRTNVEFLREELPTGRLVEMPWLNGWKPRSAGPISAAARESAEAVLDVVGLGR